MEKEKHKEISTTSDSVNMLLNLSTKTIIKNTEFNKQISGAKEVNRDGFLYYVTLFLQKLCYTIFYVAHHLFVHIEIRGRKNLKGVNGPIILAPNHTGELDVTAMPLVFSFFSKFYPIYFTTNPSDKYKMNENFGWRRYVYGGAFFDMLGGCSTYSGYNSYSISLKKHIQLLKKGRTVCIFPEGRITRDGNIGEVRGGTAYMVEVTGATVIPVAINTFYKMSFKKYLSGKRKVVITICKPMTKDEVINIENPQLEDYKAGAQRIMDRIEEAFL